MSREKKLGFFFAKADDLCRDKQAFRHAKPEEEVAPPASLPFLAIVLDLERHGFSFLHR